MLLVYICWTWGIVELKTRFETWKASNDVNGDSLFHLSYSITLMAFLCSQLTPNVQIKYFIFDLSFNRLFALNRGWKREFLQIMIFVYACSTWGIVELKTRFETWITKSDVNGVSLFNPSYLKTLMAYLCSQQAPNVQIKYFTFDWSIYRQFVLNTGWYRDSLQMMVFVNVCSTWGILELKTCFETWITRKDVNGVSLFHLSYLITLLAYLCSQWTRKVQMKYFMFDWSNYRLFVLYRG
jgi:hypothetical protein